MHGIVDNNPANDPDKKPVSSFSKFRPNFSHYYTALFGLITPSYDAECVPKDKGFSVRCQSEIDTFSLKAPLMSPVKHNKAYFFVPTRAILPHNADLLETNPLTGDDIDAEEVNCLIQKSVIYSYVVDDVMTALNSVMANATTWVQTIGAIFGAFQLWHNWFSDGAAIKRLGTSLTGMVVGPTLKSTGEAMSFDAAFEYMFSYIRTHVASFEVNFIVDTVGSSGSTYAKPTTALDSVTYLVDLSNQANNGHMGTNKQTISLYQFIEMLNQYPIGKIDNVTMNSGSGSQTPKVPYHPNAEVQSGNFSVHTEFTSGVLSLLNADKNKKYINVSRVVAYQLACCQFFSNDAVDFVYTTHLWHDNMWALYRHQGHRERVYMLNGIATDYDSVSRAVMQDILTTFAYVYNGNYGSFFYQGTSIGDPFNDDLYFGWHYFNNLLGMQRSLKYRDYFVGAKVRPMAVGNVDVQVNANKVNVVDVTKNIQMQRFLNQVQRIGRTLKAYSRGIFGVTPMQDPHEVVFIGSTSEVIGASETENTGAAQLTASQSITSHLRNESSRFAFEGSFNEFGVIIGVTCFDCPRPYVDVTDRAITHVDRFDMFNPYLQHVGDQPVFGVEIRPTQSDHFGYQLRYSEYKQRVDRADSGFRDFLPGYAFVNDYGSLAKRGSGQVKITPDFIRSRPHEFNRFYISLTNLTDAGYFHFIVRDDYSVSIDRPMEAAPSIL